MLDSISLGDTTWLGRGGYFHSAEMRVVENFTRKGDETLYEVTIEDPEVLWSRGDGAANAAAQPESRRGTSAGARVLRGVRAGGHIHPDSARMINSLRCPFFSQVRTLPDISVITIFTGCMPWCMLPRCTSHFFCAAATTCSSRPCSSFWVRFWYPLL